MKQGGIKPQLGQITRQHVAASGPSQHTVEVLLGFSSYTQSFFH